jgi:hypothetical protein
VTELEYQNRNMVTRGAITEPERAAPSTIRSTVPGRTQARVVVVNSCGRRRPNRASTRPMADSTAMARGW